MRQQAMIILIHVGTDQELVGNLKLGLNNPNVRKAGQGIRNSVSWDSGELFWLQLVETSPINSTFLSKDILGDSLECPQNGLQQRSIGAKYLLESVLWIEHEKVVRCCSIGAIQDESE